MKKLTTILIILALFTSLTTLKAQGNQDYLGLPGDNLNLYAVMKLFQESKTLEDFERDLNDGRNNINNLDLNNDNRVDYIRVIDNIDGDVHNIVLQVAVSPRENQDVAVFTVQQFNNGQVQIQLTGDEDLYGRNYIIEPITDDGGSTPNPGYTGQYVRTTTAEIAFWPVVRYIYLPSYTGWHSSWYWGYYPNYWHPWRPVSWHYYYGYHSNWYDDYYSHYRPWSYHRYTRWNDYYYVGHRSYSTEVYHRIESGRYKSTYSHPNQLRKGEERFAKDHPDQYANRSSRPSTNGNSNRRYEQPNTGNSNRRIEQQNTDRSNMDNSRRSNSNSTSRPRTTITRPDRNIENNSRSNSSNSVTNPTRDNNSGNIRSTESRRSVNTTESPTIRSGDNSNTNSVRQTETRRTESQSQVRQSNRKSDNTGSQSVRSSERQSRRENKSAAASEKKERTKSDSDNKDRERR